MDTLTGYLVRHGTAESFHAQGDRHRALTDAGRRAFEAHAQGLRASIRAHRIITSPFVRARQTADILGGVLGLAVVEDARLGSGTSSGGELLDLLREHGHGTVLVGHNPEMTEALARAGGVHAVAPGTVAEVTLLPVRSVAWARSPGA